MRWTWALLCLAGGRAGGTRVVVEDFKTKAGYWTDTGEVLGLPESVQPPVGTIQLTNEGETLRVDYDVAFTALYGTVRALRREQDVSLLHDIWWPRRTRPALPDVLPLLDAPRRGSTSSVGRRV